MSEHLDPSVLRELLRYEPDTGKLFWLPRDVRWFNTDREHKRWNTRYAGKEAFTALHGDGYLRGYVLGQQHFKHRVVWAIETGAWPEQDVDHEDHDRSNNVRSNLSEATRAQNARNRSRASNNKSGVTGVSWYARTAKWSAQIRVADGKQLHLGYFNDLRDAVAARKTAEREHGYHPNHGAAA